MPNSQLFKFDVGYPDAPMKIKHSIAQIANRNCLNLYFWRHWQDKPKQKEARQRDQGLRNAIGKLKNGNNVNSLIAGFDCIGLSLL
jgi:hypothetical protein